ncbi:MAG: hypothetical protein EG823_03105 [Actinobacteria bacterium]|nr:hypothetical protein [Actinomycetota bacterium]
MQARVADVPCPEGRRCEDVGEWSFVLSLLLLTVIEPASLGVVMVGFIAYLLTYILRLLKTLDTPFRVHEHAQDGVSLFLAGDLEQRLAE